MALRFLDSAGQHYLNGTSGATQYLVLRKWTISGSEVTPTGGRRNEPYLGAGGAMKTLTQNDNWILGAAYQLNGGQATLHQVQNAGNAIAQLHLNVDYTLSVILNNTTIFTSTLSVTDASTWHYYEVAWFMSGVGTALGTLTGSLWVDGDLWGTYSGNALSTGGDYINGSFTANMVGFGGNCNMMDYYAVDTNATDINGLTTTNTARWGDIQIMALFPATSVTTGWGTVGGDGTNAWSCVNEDSPDDDTSYVYSSSTTSSEVFNYQSISTFTGTILGAQYSVCAKKTAEGSREIAMTLGTATLNSENFLGAANYLSDYYVYYICPLDSNLGTGWTVANYDSAQFGVTLSG